MPQYCGARITELQKSTYSSYANLNLQSGEEAINFVHQYIRDCVDSSNPDWAGIEGHIYLVEVKTRSISVEYCTGVSSIAFPLLCHNHQSTFGIPFASSGIYPLVQVDVAEHGSIRQRAITKEPDLIRFCFGPGR